MEEIKMMKNDAGHLPASVPVKLAELVDYASGSIVSRTLLKNNAGTITLFSFDKGQELSEHSTPFDAIVQVLDGEAELTIGGNPIRTIAGETILMPAAIPHAVKAVKRFKMLLTMVRG